MAKNWWDSLPDADESLGGGGGNWWDSLPDADESLDQPGDWDFLSQYGQKSKQPAVEEPPSRELLDYGKSALSGVVRFPESIVGLVDLFNTPHRAVFEKVTGKDAKTVTEILADIGVDFAGARDILAESKSEGSKAEREAVNKAFADDGIFGGLKSLGSNPQVIAETVVESVPEMLSLAGLVRVAAVNVFSKAVAAATSAGATREAAIIAGRQAVEQAAPRLATLSTVLEGAQSAGNQAAEYAAEGRLKERQALASLAGGAGVAAVGFGLNRVAPRLGLEDVETALATGALRGGRGGIVDRVRGAVSGAAKGALREGPLEEGAQSYLEQIAQNFGDERPLFEGTGQAAVEGMLAGTVLGAGGGGFAGARPDRAEQLARQLDQDIDATNWAPESDTRVAVDMLSPDRGVASQAPTSAAPPAVEPAPAPVAPMQPEATVPPSVTTTWVDDDGIPHPVQVVQADVPVEGDPRPHSLVSYAGTEVLVPSDQLQSAPRREINFTPADSPTAQAGLQPIIVPEVTPNVSRTDAPVPVPAGSSGLGGTDAIGSLGVAGRNDVGGRRLVDTGAEPGAAGASAVVGGGAAAQPTPSVVEWTGRNGNGYATLEDAMRGLTRRQQLAPGYDWRVEPAGDRFKLVGERIEQAPVQTETEAAVTAGPTEAGQAETLRDMGDLESAAARRATAQAALDRLANQGRIERISLGEPDPVLAQQVQDLGDTLTRAFGSDTKVVPFASDDASAPQGMQLGNLLLIDTVTPQNPVANTTLHEFKHSIEAIAAADTRAGRKNTPAQRFTEQIHSLFDDMSEEGKRSYLENFLRRDELRGITDPVEREARIQELLGSDELRSEMTADFMGNRANDREWLADLARTDPEGFRGFVQKWIDLLDNLVKSLRGIKNQSRMESARVDQYVKDLNRAKMVARDALVEFRKSTTKPTGVREGAAAGTTAGGPGARPRSSVRDAWLNRRVGQPRFSTRQPMDGRAFTGFFSNITAGLTGRPGDRAFTPTLNVDGISEFVREYERHRGNFDDHIGTSIPTFRELQTIVGDAIVKSFDNADMLDVGASEGALVKTISKLSNGSIRTVALDPNPSMAAHFNSGERVPGSKYAVEAFGTRAEEGLEAWVEDDVLVDRDGSTRPNPYAGQQIRFYKPDRKFDVVHEAMVFQFINADRAQQVSRIKELMKPGGIVILEEKFIPGPGLSKSQFDANEAQKDAFKEQYFTREQIEAKARAVGVKDQEAYRKAQAEQESQVVGMADLMVAPAQLEKVLGDNFQHVVQFWDAGNFKGYMASDSRANLENLLGNMVDVNSEFSTTQTPRWVGDSAPLMSRTRVDARTVGRSDELTFSRRQQIAENFLPNRPGSPGNEDVRGYGAPVPTTVAGVGPARKYPMTDEFRQTVTDSGLTPVDMVELPMTQSAATRFEQAVQDSKAASRYGAAVYVYPVNEYRDMRLFQAEDGRSGFAIKPDGDIVSVYSDGGGKVHSMLALAVEQGGTKLDAFDTVLPELYSINGFREVRREPWNDRFRPEGWDKNTFADFNNGEPDVVYMEYDANYIPDLGVTEQQETTRGDREGRVASRELAPLEGAPVIRGATGPDPEIVRVAETYARKAGIPYTRQTEYVDINESRARRLADAYDRMEHAPNDPAVREAYENLIRQTTAQYRALEDAGYRFYFYDETNDPYDGNPWNAMRDLRANKVMGVFATEADFGSGATELDVTDNPLLADTGITWPWGSLDGQPKRVLANDLFRAVHDAFGHGLEGAGFRARGEENAWQAHARLFTGSALAALTSETRGQNSWLNYGPYGEQNRTAKVEDTVFADQKTGLMPEWTWTEGLVGGVEQSPLRQAADRVIKDSIQRAAVESVLGGRVAEMSDTQLRDAVSRAAQDPVRRRVIAQTEAGRQLLDAATSTEPEQVPMFSARQPLGFYSELSRRVEDGPTSAMKDQWKGYINGLKQKGVKPDEIEWSGVLDWLDMQTGKVSRDDVLNFLDNNGVQLEEVTSEEVTSYSESMLMYGPSQTEFGEWDVYGIDGDVINTFPTQEDARRFARGGDFARKYDSYTVPGDSSNYREVLLKLPAPGEQVSPDFLNKVRREYLPNGLIGITLPSGLRHTARTDVEADAIIERAARNSKAMTHLGAYKSSHWDQPNVIAHVRTTDRVDADGNRVLFVEEVQSDWAQEGRQKGFTSDAPGYQVGDDVPGWGVIQAIRGEDGSREFDVGGLWVNESRLPAPASDRRAHAIPRAPFVTSTDKWVSLAIKRILTMAAEGGYDKVAFVNGEQAAEMFDLSNQISEVNYNPGDEWLVAYDHNGGRVFDEWVAPEDLDNYVGKELADRIRGDVESNRAEQDRERGEWSAELDEDPDTGEEFYILIDSNGEPLYSNFGDLERFDTEADAREWIDENVATGLDDVNLSGLDLKVGGEGMRGFYDNILPKVLRNVGKRVGAKVESINLDGTDQIGITITPEMREKITTEGLPMFSQRQTDTPEFKRWFGDSKAVDFVNADTGAPIVSSKEPARAVPKIMYHTTLADFEAFEVGRSTVNSGTFGSWETERHAIFVTPDINSSQAYGTRGGVFADGANVMPLYIKAENPLDLTEGVSEEDFTKLERAGMSPRYILNNLGHWEMFDGDGGRDVVEMIKAAGYDSVIFNDENPDTGESFESWAVFHPTQIKSATGNRGTFDPTDPDITMSRRQNALGQAGPHIDWTVGDTGLLDNFIYLFQDKHVDLKRVQQAITEGGKQIEDQWDAYLKEGLYHGRAADQTLRFMRDEIRPLMVEIKARGESIESLEEYLHNAHAISRNAQIRKINPNMQDAGSGIPDKAAQTYLDNLPADRRNRLEALAKRVRDIIHKTQDVLVAGGLETQETIDTWRKVYPDYVPLEREDLDFGMGNALVPGSGQGYSVRGSSSKRATGSTRPVKNILANIALQRENAITRAEKNRVATALYGLAVQNPNTNFWLPVNPDMKFTNRGRASLASELVSMGLNPLDARGVIEEPKQQYIDPITGLVTQRVNPALRNSDNVIALRINGQDRYLFLNNRDPRAQRMAVALKNLDPSQMNLALRTSASITRWLASVNTQYNPIFGVVNFTRDIQAAALNLTTTELAGKQVQVMKAVPGALGAIYNDLRKDRGMKSRPNSEWNRLWREFSEIGAKTGYREQFRTSDERHNALFREMNNLHGSIPRRGFNAVFGWLSDYNEAGENAVRLAAYKVALDNGMSKERAAMLAKDLTVNFNRKGHVTQQMSALYAFFNASLQGTERTFRTLRGPAGAKIIAGGLLLGVLQALGLAMAGFGEDEPPEFVRERNIIIPIPGGDPKDYITIPMPLGFHVIPNTSRLLTEGWLRGWTDKGDLAMNLIGSVLDAFNPIGHAGWSWQTVFPTAVDPLIALLENRDWSGRPIYRESFSGRDVSPGTDRAMSTATWWSKEIAKYLNLASGGTEFTAGKFSPTPDQIDYLIGQATGGVGREASKAAQLVESIRTGESLPPYKVPLAGRFYGTTSGPAGPSSTFYSNLERMARHRAEIDGRVEQRQSTGEYFNQHPEARLAKEALVAENEVRKARRRMREAIERGDRERVREIEERIANVMTRFNEKVDARNGERSERRRMIREAVSR